MLFYLTLFSSYNTSNIFLRVRSEGLFWLSEASSLLEIFLLTALNNQAPNKNFDISFTFNYEVGV